LKGIPLTESDPAWTTDSCSPIHFTQPLGLVSLYLTIQESSLVLWLRSLELANAPVHLGTKLGLALGTVRRLEHDEMDQLFGYCDGSTHKAEKRPGEHNSQPGSQVTENRKHMTDVYVREKVRVESADPSLMSLSAKLIALGHTLAQARRNLAAVLDEELEE
jgi:hypothetical protein